MSQVRSIKPGDHPEIGLYSNRFILMKWAFYPDISNL